MPVPANHFCPLWLRISTIIPSRFLSLFVLSYCLKGLRMTPIQKAIKKEIESRRKCRRLARQGRLRMEDVSLAFALQLRPSDIRVDMDSVRKMSAELEINPSTRL
jgi:hypothetical protein